MGSNNDAEIAASASVPKLTRGSFTEDLMQTTLTIRDELTSNIGKTDYVITIHLTAKQLTVRDLIRERVRQEVEDFNNKQPEYFNGLVQPTDTERTLNGFKFRQRRKLDWQEQFEKAIDGFQRNAFVLLVDDSQVEDLDEMISLSVKSQVTFLKLVPLVGG
jgi:hypothetical protein